jgi:NADP-dependent 3-hydroxy acid dehydrogenase YdfG
MGAKVGIITGASSGIGAATAVEFARSGAKLVLAARTGDDLDETVAAVAAAGGDSKTVYLDVRDPGQLAGLPNLASESFGQLDFLVANAGIHDSSSIVDGDPERWRAIVETNLLGAAFTVRAVLPTMIAQGSGDIVLMASLSGREIYLGAPMYMASKWALVAFGHALRKEMNPHRIRVTLVEPGLVDTPLSRGDPLVRPFLDVAEPLQADDIARAVVYACAQPEHVLVSELAIRPHLQPDLVALDTDAKGE